MRRKLGAVGGALGLFVFVLYLRTLAPSVPTGDSGDLITAAWVLGVAHPPGYPLFTMLGHMASALPVGSPAMRINLVSAIFGAAAVALTGILAARVLLNARPQLSGDPESAATRPSRTRRRTAAVPPTVSAQAPGAPVSDRAGDVIIASMLGASLLAVSTAFWKYSVVAEVFSMNAFFAALLLLLLLEWSRRPTAFRLFWCAALVVGLAAANQQTIALLAPGLLVLLIVGAHGLGMPIPPRVAALLGAGPMAPSIERMQWARLVGVAALLTGLGLLVYLYLPIAASADPPLNWGDPRTAERFVQHILRTQYGSGTLMVQEAGKRGSSLDNVGVQLRYYWDAFTPVGVVLALLGWWWLWGHRRAFSIALGAGFLASGPLFVAYAAPPLDVALTLGVLDRFAIMPSVLLAIAVASGAYALLAVARARARPEWSRALPALGTLAAIAVVAGSAGVHWATADESGNWLDHQFAEDTLRPLGQGALLLTHGDTATLATEYIRMVEGFRPDVVAIDMEKLKLGTYAAQLRRQHPDVVIPFSTYDATATSLSALIRANAANRPVYSTGLALANQLPDYDYLEDGFAGQLVPKGQTSDHLALIRQNVSFFAGLGYPTHVYPDTAFEFGIQQNYGQIAAQVASVLDDAGNQAEAARMYTIATRLQTSDPTAYKNLAVILMQQNGDAGTVASLLDQYLRMNPQDPQADAIRNQIQSIRKR